MAILFLILRALTAIFGAFVFTAILVMSKDLWEYDKLFFCRGYFCRCVCSLPHDFRDSYLTERENAG